MSLESALDDEMREVMNLLEGRPADYGSSRTVPQPERTASPVAPVRSMLDVGPAGPPRHGSVAGVGGAGVTAPPVRSVPAARSMLDPYSPLTPVSSAQSGPAAISVPRSPSIDSTTKVIDDAGSRTTRPRAGSNSSNNLPYSRDQFDMTSAVSGPALPKRVTQGGKKGMSSMASIMQGQELDPVSMKTSRGRHNSTAGILGPKSSRSPSSRLSQRSESPGTKRILNTNSFNPMTMPGKFVSESGKIIDLNNAYRKLSDANLLKSGSSLSTAPDAALRARMDSGETLSPSGELRLEKDYYDKEGEEAIESSEEMTSDEEAWGRGGGSGGGSGRGHRGRSRRKQDGSDATAEAAQTILRGSKQDPSELPRVAQSLLAAAEEERVSVSSKYKVKSLLEPTVTVTGPGGEKLVSVVKKSSVHPNTNYNAQISRAGSPNASDSEELGDIRRAQKLEIKMSRIDTSIPNRVLRTIVRGDFTSLYRESEQGERRLRTYLVATDLSGEAAYALEWTIGTVLRDGDTLLAVYAVDEEIGTGRTGSISAAAGGVTSGGADGESPEPTSPTYEPTTSVSRTAEGVRPPFVLPPLGSGGAGGGGSIGGSVSRTASVDSRMTSKAEVQEHERRRAIEDISETCVKFLRKTRLQVRIAVEVIHCKSPKYMITEAIDVLQPTLVILGSRGRSALKGVLLGSFSNYLVTKSSVPVMVARKKLQKPSSKNKLPHVRLANNLVNPRRLEEAIID